MSCPALLGLDLTALMSEIHLHGIVRFSVIDLLEPLETQNLLA